MAYVDKINVQGTYYDIQDKRLPESNGVVNLNAGFTANEIIEKNTGLFSYRDTTSRWTPTYVGAVKNGNKITIVFFGSITKTAEMTEGALGYFNISSSLGQKLYPYELGSSNLVLDTKNISCFSDRSSSVQVTCEIIKPNNSTLIVNILNIGNMVNGTTYLFRYEVTLLLSDNLAA